MADWKDCKNILCIRPDNLGDLIMSGPAIRALKETFGAKITILTSSMAAGIAKFLPQIDNVIVFDVPWVKTNQQPEPDQFIEIVDELKRHEFDAAVIFTVYSQNPLPTAMIPYMAGIPKRLAYCRENPYQLLTDWVPDKEPYHTIKHQVRRDLDLVAAVGAVTNDENLNLGVDTELAGAVDQKLMQAGVDLKKPWLILHPGVSEVKRLYNEEEWARAGKRIINDLGYQVLITGVQSEKELTDRIASQIGAGAFSLAGLFNLSEFILLISRAPLLLSVNTGTVHIAAAVGTPTVVLYALTNPQHTPWNVPSKVLTFAVPLHLQSKNEVIAHGNRHFSRLDHITPDADDIVSAAEQLLNGDAQPYFYDEPRLLNAAGI
jgi:lipopolysaccharide heptosyltransferase II